MEKSFSDHIAEILEVTEGNPVLKDLLLGLFFNNLPDRISRDIKKMLDTYKFKPRLKSGWLCLHKDCREKSCASHEISENAILKNICSPESNVTILKRDIKNNPIFYVEGIQHKRNATNFPGYCSIHDASLFSDIDASDTLFDIRYVNKQCLRTTRAQIFEIDFQLKACEIFVKGVSEEIREDEVVVQVISHFNNKKTMLETKRQRLWSIYDVIFDGIESEKYALSFKVLSKGMPGFCFSACLDLSMDEDKDPCILYAFKLDLKSSSETFVAYLNNDISMRLAEDFEKYQQLRFGQIIYEQKSKLILSGEFTSLIPEHIKEILYKDDELYEIGPVQHYVISTAFFEPR